MNSKHMLWVSYITSTLPVLMLLFSGIMKLVKPPSVTEGFAHLGYDESVALGLGVVELLATLLLTGYLGGATATHLRIGEPFHMAILLGVFVWGGLYLRDERLRLLIPLRTS
jgi:hypothetical protein